MVARPVGDQEARRLATDTAQGTIVKTQKFLIGQTITVRWHTESGAVFQSQFDVTDDPPDQVGDPFLVDFDPAHPGSSALPDDPGETPNADFRDSAVFQSAVPFTWALLFFGLGLVWPRRQEPCLLSSGAESELRRTLWRYLALPGLAAVALVVVGMSAEAVATHSLLSSLVTVIAALLEVPILIWVIVRALRHRQFMELLSRPSDALDPRAFVVGLHGRSRLIASAKLSRTSELNLSTPCLKVRLLSGQPANHPAPEETVRLYGRPSGQGPLALASASGSVALGFAHSLTIPSEC
jgi:hypothetical protein